LGFTPAEFRRRHGEELLAVSSRVAELGMGGEMVLSRAMLTGLAIVGVVVWRLSAFFSGSIILTAPDDLRLHYALLGLWHLIFGFAGVLVFGRYSGGEG
jgi:hypothetical protein